MEVTLEITNYCDNNCDYCSTNSTDDKKIASYLTVRSIVNFLEDIKSKYGITRINISGGEPLAHFDFYSIIQTCRQYSDNIWVYTNAINQIMYNTDVVEEIKVEANVCLRPGNIYIPEKVDRVHLLQLVPQGRAKHMKPSNFHVSSNIMTQSDYHNCNNCHHILLQADNKIVEAPCKKDY